MQSVMEQRLLKRRQEVTLSAEDGQALLERLESGALQAEDRHQLAQVIRVTQACQALLEVSSTPAATATQHKAKRKRQMAQASRRRHRREGYPWRAGQRSCGGLNEVCPAEAMSVQGGRVQRARAM
jgi:hypothetical protein